MPGQQAEAPQAAASPGDRLAARLQESLARLLRIAKEQPEDGGAAASKALIEAGTQEDERAARTLEAMRIAAGLDRPWRAPQQSPGLPQAGEGGGLSDLLTGGLSVHFLGEEGGLPSLGGVSAIRPSCRAEEPAVPPDPAAEPARPGAASCSPQRQSSPWVKAGSRPARQEPTQAVALEEARRAQVHALQARLEALGAALTAARRRAEERKPPPIPASRRLAHLLMAAKLHAIALWRRLPSPRSGALLARVHSKVCGGQWSRAPVMHAARAVPYLLAAMVLAAVVFPFLTKTEIVIHGRGWVIAGTPPITVHPPERAVLREVSVKVGDRVHKGQVLATLDPAVASAEVEALVLQRKSLEAQIRRIEAEAAGVPFAPAARGSTDDMLQAALSGRRQSQYSARLRAFDEEISGLEARIAAAKYDRGFLARQLSIASEMEDRRATLWQGQLTSKLELLEAQGARLRFARDHQNVVDKLAELQHSAMAKRAERQAFIDGWRQQVLEDLMTRRAELGRVNEKLARASRPHPAMQLTAPGDGVVLNVAPRPAGAAVGEADSLVTLAPAHAPLMAEVVTGPADIGYASPGDRVVIKMDAFPYQRHGLIEGRLLSVSEEPLDAVPRPTGTAGVEGAPWPSIGATLYRARIALTGTKLAKLPEGVRLVPGMTLSAEIKAGKRSAFADYLYPVTLDP